MAPQALSEKDIRLLETKPLIVIIKTLAITVVVLISAGTAFFFHMEGQVAGARAETKEARNETRDVTLKLIEKVEQSAEAKRNFNDVLHSKYYEDRNSNSDNSADMRPDIKGKQ